LALKQGGYVAQPVELDPRLLCDKLARIATDCACVIAGGYFSAQTDYRKSYAPVAAAARALGITRTVDIPDVEAPAPPLISSPPAKAAICISKI